ncbi:MAG: 3-phosphoglycerate dehydrogenase [Bacteroidetes bacterium]|nr:3-phosphoglycerate dehydrogenase [Bacteroidota bacterium]
MSLTILANDGLATSGIDALTAGGHTVITTKVAQSQLIDYINQHKVDAILVRSATTVRQDMIDACPSLKMVGRGGVGMDNIDVDYAKSKGLKVFNTPAASSDSVAELVFAHLFGMVRHLHDANRNMPLDGDSQFGQLKKTYAKGSELSGKTIGIIGFGRIGKAVARRAYGVGMRVIVHDPHLLDGGLEVAFADGQILKTSASMLSMNEVLRAADVVTLHIGGNSELIDAKALATMKEGAFLINAARGGVVNEPALIDALKSQHIKAAGLDVFVDEPKPSVQILMNPHVSLTPHIGAATVEAQARIGLELAEQIMAKS